MIPSPSTCKEEEPHKAKDGTYTEAYYPITNLCNKDSCLLQNNGKEVIGYGTINGYFKKRPKYTADGYTLPDETCDGLVITGGSPDIIDGFKELIRTSNGVNSINANGQVEVHISSHGVDVNDWKRIRASTVDSSISLKVMLNIPFGMEAPACFSMFDIVTVN